MPKYEELVKQKEEINTLKNKVHDAELETSLIKAVGMNSPEMKAAKEKITELEQELLETKLDNKMLAEQISTMMERMRDADF